jgi:hypothetical protein
MLSSLSTSDLVRRAEKQERKVQKYPLFDDRREEFGDFSFPNVSFSSEAGKVLTFFASFFGSSQKMKWGLG